ncbi:hypothetical protein OG418_30025 [Streptomyces phaeochromogenes]|uniref:hypothetical protein n=1 Tax=Streptomyces phaeochromogenes TaxID=1923 RepID=UPI0032471D3F
MTTEIVTALLEGQVLLPLAVIVVGALKVWLKYRRAVVVEQGRTARLRSVLHTVRPELRAEVITAYASVEAVPPDVPGPGA